MFHAGCGIVIVFLGRLGAGIGWGGIIINLLLGRVQAGAVR